MTEASFRACRLYKVLGNPLRYKILQDLAGSPMTPTNLALRTHRSLSAVSRSLSLLHWPGLVWYQTCGHHIVYGLRHDDLAGFLADGEEFAERHHLQVPPPPTDLSCRSPEDPYWLGPGAVPRIHAP